MAKADSPATSAPSPAKLRKFIERYLAAWNDHDAAAIVPLVTEYVVWTDPALPEPARTLRGATRGRAVPRWPAGAARAVS